MPEYKAPQQAVFYRQSINGGHKVKAWQCIHSVILEKLPKKWNILYLSLRFWKFAREAREILLFCSLLETSLYWEKDESYFSYIKFCTITGDVMNLLANFRTPKWQVPSPPSPNYAVTKHMDFRRLVFWVCSFKKIYKHILYTKYGFNILLEPLLTNTFLPIRILTSILKIDSLILFIWKSSSFHFSIIIWDRYTN